MFFEMCDSVQKMEKMCKLLNGRADNLAAEIESINRISLLKDARTAHVEVECTVLCARMNVMETEIAALKSAATSVKKQRRRAKKHE